MSNPHTERDERVSDDEAYRIVEEMGLGLTFRSCACGQLPCARLRPIRDALTTARKEARAAAFKETIQIVNSLPADCWDGYVNPKTITDKLALAAASELQSINATKAVRSVQEETSDLGIQSK